MHTYQMERLYWKMILDIEVLSYIHLLLQLFEHLIELNHYGTKQEEAWVENLNIYIFLQYYLLTKRLFLDLWTTAGMDVFKLVLLLPRKEDSDEEILSGPDTDKVSSVMTTMFLFLFLFSCFLFQRAVLIIFFEK